MAGVAERTLALKLIGDVSGLRKDLAPAQRQFGRFTKSMASWGKAIAGGVVIGGIERLTGALGDAWDGYRSGEKAAAGMRKQWRNLGLQGKAFQRTLDAVTDSTLKLGTSDDEAVEAFTRSLNRTRDYKQSLRELGIAQDLVANGSAPNLESAFRLIQQAGKGSARVVDRFGLSAKTSGGRIAELGQQVRGAAKTKARLEPLQVLFNRMGEDLESIVGSFAKGDFKGFAKGLGSLGETVSDALFGPAGKDKVRNSKTKGLVNQFGGWASSLATGISDAFKDVDWGQTLSDTLNSALGAVKEAADNGTLTNLLTLGAAITAGLFVVEAAVAALTALFSVPKLLVKGVIAAITNVGVSIAATMFGAEGVAAKVGSTMATTIRGAGSNRSLKGAAVSLGGTIGRWVGPIAAGLIIAEVADALLDNFGWPKPGTGFDGQPTQVERVKGIRRPNRGQRGAAADAEAFRRSKGSGGGKGSKTGFAAGTSNAFRGWHWVGENGPELMRFRGGEQVMPHQQSMAMAAGGGAPINVYVTAGVGDPVEIGRQVDRVLREFRKRSGGL